MSQRNIKNLKPMEKLIEKLNELRRNHFSGTVTLSFYQGSLSKKVKVEVIENLNLDGSSTEIDWVNRKSKP